MNTANIVTIAIRALLGRGKILAALESAGGHGAAMMAERHFRHKPGG